MKLSEIIEPLNSWYEQNKRQLPWRESGNPYYVWISEIMLQQTRVEAVKPYFKRFITALPDIPSVAKAPEEQLLKLWEGLGYYNRVRNIQKAAIEIVNQYDGQMPADYEALKKLPGIGNYTAGAVASIAFHIPVPAVDGNVLRVISRIDLRDEDIMKQSVRKKMEDDLLAIMPQDAGTFNQALMELGATVCVPNGAPNCSACPVVHLCGAYEQGRIEELPVKAPKKKRRMEEKTVLVIQDGQKVALHKRPNKGLLAGLYELPNLEGHLTDQQVIDYVDGLGLESLRIRPLEDARHIFSHVEWHMKGYAIQVSQLEQDQLEDLVFVSQRQTQDAYAIPAAFSAFTRYMNIYLGQEKFQRT